MKLQSSKYDLFIVCGEHSGDQHASLFTKKLLEKHPELSVGGVLGPKLRELGLLPFMKMEDFRVMGFVDVFLAFPKIYKQFYQILNHILETKPKVVVFVDYPGLNLRLAKKLREKGYKGKLVQFVCPSFWAWGSHRLPQTQKDLDLLFCIFPFEPEIFPEQQGFKALYVGNPSAELIDSFAYNPDWKSKIGITPEQKIIGVFPGSRRKEIKENFPKMLRTLQKFKQNHKDACFVISIADQELGEYILSWCKASSLKLNEDLYFVDRKDTLSLMKDCHTACAKSGTVNLELALMKKPTVVVYNVSTLNYFLGKYLFKIKLKFFCIVNIIMKKEVFPELLYRQFSSRNLSQHLERLYSKGPVREQVLQDCNNLYDRLSEKHCSEETSKLLSDVIFNNT
ncbi:MAG: lipid-A-disaccharide synthase [Chlamydiales bacterium]|nr:lipid-A-disaccharide synthase [Chlamydiales bacterium]